MDFQERDYIREAVAAAYALTVERSRGDMIAHEEIEKATGIERYTRHWGTVVKKLKRVVLQKRGIALWPVPEVGYKLSTVSEQLNDIPHQRQKRATRQLIRGAREIGAVPARELSGHERFVRARKLDGLVDSRRALKREMAAQAVLYKQTGDFANRKRPRPR